MYSVDGSRSVLVSGFNPGTSALQIARHMAVAGTIHCVPFAHSQRVCITFTSAAEANVALSLLQSTCVAGNNCCIRVVRCGLVQQLLMKGIARSAKGRAKGKRRAAGTILLVGCDFSPEKVVVTCQRRRENPQSWEFPKGGMESVDDDDCKRCALRELKEETGLMNNFCLKEIYSYGSGHFIYWHLAKARDESELIWGPIKDEDTVEARCYEIDKALSLLRHDHKSLLHCIIEDIRANRLAW